MPSATMQNGWPEGQPLLILMIYFVIQWDTTTFLVMLPSLLS